MENNIEKNYERYSRYLVNLIGEESLNKIIEAVGGEEKLKNASFAINKDSGLAFGGAMIGACLEIGAYAAKINDVLPEGKRVEPSKIWKVALLQHISKSLVYEENLNEWDKQNRGLMYRFTNKDVTLKCGEYSVMLSSNAGVIFTEDEYEAMRINDKVREDGDIRNNWCTLSMIIRMANEIINRVNKE